MPILAPKYKKRIRKAKSQEMTTRIVYQKLFSLQSRHLLCSTVLSVYTMYTAAKNSKILLFSFCAFTKISLNPEVRGGPTAGLKEEEEGTKKNKV